MFVNGKTVHWQRSMLRLLAAALCTLVVSTMVTAANAAAPPPSLTVNLASGASGTAITVSGSNFPKRVGVTLTWDNSTAGMPTTSTVRNGSFSLSVTIPATATLGTHTVAVNAGGVTASTILQVVEASTLATAASPTATATASPTATTTATATPTVAATSTATANVTATASPPSATSAATPNSTVMPAPAPCSGVQIYPPNGFTASLVSSYPQGTSFCLAAGTFTMTKSVILPSYDKVTGASETGTVLDFSTTTLDGQSGDNYALYGYGGSTGQHDVTIQNLSIQNCHTSTYSCTALKEGSNWTVTGVELRSNDIGLAGSCTSCYIHDNAVYGVAGAVDIESSEMSFNGGTNDGGGSTGGSKSVQLVNMTWRGNYIHDNRGPAIWCDGCWQGSTVLIDSNRIENNLGPGIDFEISWGSCATCGGGSAVAQNNTLKGNDTADLGKSCFWGAQIYINNSEGIQVTGNTIDSSGGTNALCAVDTTRSDTFPTYPEYLAPFTATGNTMILHSTAQVGEAGYQGGYQLDATTFGVQNNTYKVDSLTSNHWSWYQSTSSLNFGQWESYGMDSASTMTVG